MNEKEQKQKDILMNEKVRLKTANEKFDEMSCTQF